MNKIVCMTMFAAASAFATAATNEVDVGDVIAEAAKVIAENGWTAKDVGSALRSLRGLYLRDNATAEGRRRWNGEIVSRVVDPSNGVQISTYENGEVFVDPARVVTTPATAAEELNRRLAAMTNGVPAKLAELRAKVARDKATTNEVTQVITAGGAGGSL